MKPMATRTIQIQGPEERLIIRGGDWREEEWAEGMSGV